MKVRRGGWEAGRGELEVSVGLIFQGFKTLITSFFKLQASRFSQYLT